MADEMLNMRRDAVRRAREMYARARPNEDDNQPAPPTPITKPQHFPDTTPTAIEKGPDIFETFFQDKEKMMILALLVMLSQEENSDNGLLFSLLFLLI